MKKFKIYNILIFCLLFLSLLSSCKKQNDFLNEKPNSQLSAITTLQDCQNLLQDERLLNLFYSPCLGEVSSDDYYMSDVNLATQSSTDLNIYTWANRIYDQGADNANWSHPYSVVFVANTVLDALKSNTIKISDISFANKIKGEALFFRSYSFFNLLQTFSMPFDSAKASSDLGVPLRLSSDLNVPSHRSSQIDCYHQIIEDLKTAIQLLPKTNQFCTLPSQQAAFALLSRVYLVMGDYPDAKGATESALNISNIITDYNNIPPPSSFVYFTTSNLFPLPEDIFHSVMNNDKLLQLKYSVDSSLYKLYDDNDLRKTKFYYLYNGNRIFVGSYEFKGANSLTNYDGLATDELVLTQAECYARSGDISSAMADLNLLLVKRYKTGTFIPRSATSSLDALTQILTERRKELVFRGIRWTDLRRLNKDPRFAVTMTRVYKGITYTLPPNDPRYALPIPDNEIQLSGIQQNVR